VFADLGEGFIEVRLIEDRKGGALVERQWYPSAQELIDDLPRLWDLAAARVAAVFFGVLPRRERGKGKAEDTIASSVAWADLDFKDYAGGEAEARKRLAEFPLQPTLVVCSGHGLHAYWLLREPAPPAELSDLSRQLANALGGDHAFDAARILRLPGTANRKDPAHPTLVVIEALDPARAYNSTELVDVLGMFAESSSAGANPGPRQDGDRRITRPLYPLILGLLGNQRLRSIFEGTGKPELRDDGKPYDRSSSGYDFSLVLALRRKGVKDADQLGNALWNRPDGAAREKGIDYIRRTVDEALKRFDQFEDEREEEDAEIDFVVEKVRVFASVPPVHEILIAGKSITLTTSQLLSRDSFTLAFVNTHRRVPTLPKRWSEQVNTWLAEAEIVEQPPEASDEHALREAVQRVIADLPVGEEVGDLDHGKAVLLEGGAKAFKVDPVLKLLLEDWKGLKRNDLCRVLKDLGYESLPRKVGQERAQARAWAPRGNA
jgi:hypothetical protein